MLTDLRVGFRRLVKTPAASIAVLAAISTGIGMCALMFSAIDGAILATLPFENGDRIVRIVRPDFSPVTAESYLYWEEHQGSFEGLAIAAERTVNLAAEGMATEPVSTAALTASAFELLSVEPVLGRGFVLADAAAGASPVAVISGNLWRSRFDSDSDILGRVVRLSSMPFEIVGVMDEGFRFPCCQDVWIPQQLDALRPDGNPERFIVFGTLRDGVSRETAAAELDALDARLSLESGEERPTPIEVAEFTDIFNPKGVADVLAGIMLCVALLVLLVACANATNVLLARAAVRSREVAVRAALGASRGRIAAQYWIEVSMLAFGGAVGGVVLTLVGARVTRNAMASSEGLPFWWDLRVDVPVLAFVTVVAVVAAFVAGVAPAAFASRANGHELLKDASRSVSSRRSGRLMRRLIAAEIAVSLVLLVAAGLFIRSALNVRTVEFRFEPEQIYTALVTVPPDRYPTGDARTALAERLEESLAAIPGSSSSAVATELPAIGGLRRDVAIEGSQLPDDDGLPSTTYVATTPGFFTTFRAPALTGRLFDARDRSDTLPVAVVSTSFERLYLPQGAVGQRIALGQRGGAGVGTGDADAAAPRWLTVVGVVPDLVTQLGDVLPDAVYVPFAQAAPSAMWVAVRSRSSAEVLAGPIRQTVAALDDDIALTYMRSMADAIDAANAAFGWLGGLFFAAGCLALSLAVIGLYGVMAFWVAQRTREIGVRMAVGGGRGRIVVFVLRNGLIPVAIGLICGLVVVLPLAWVVRGLLVDVGPFDPVVLGGVVGVLLLAGWLGCLGPAVRATRVHPQTALGMD